MRISKNIDQILSEKHWE